VDPAEADLVRSAAAGDRGAYARLIERHWCRLVRLARSVVGEAEAEDSVQDALIRAWRFDAALRSWAAHAPRTEPGEAARRIAPRLPERRLAGRRSVAGRPGLWLAAAALVLAMGLAALLVGPFSPLGDRPPPADGAAPPPGVPVAPAGDVLVIELDSETTLYMTLGHGTDNPSRTPGDPS
jgi:hypothetical protein